VLKGEVNAMHPFI